MLKRIITLTLIMITMLALVAEAAELKVEVKKAKTWRPELSIGLKMATQVKISVDQASKIIDVKSKSRIRNVKANEELLIANEGGKIKINGKEIKNTNIELRLKDLETVKDMKVKIDGKEYLGSVRLTVKGNKLTVINIITTEEYLRGVIPKEMLPSFHEEALKAQAVAARTFALMNRKRHSKDGYDLCSTTHCQAYTGTADISDKTDKAIFDTYGEVIQYKGKMILAPFHSDSGGMTENSLDAWSLDCPYLRAVPEIKKLTSPWNVKMEIAEFGKKLEAAKKGVGDVKFIKSTPLEIGKLTEDRSASGRIKYIVVYGSNGDAKITGKEMRDIFKLKSTLFEISITNKEVVINGYGWGHGVGMSQNGAEEFANHSYTYDKILAKYYTGTNLKRIY